MRNTSLSAASGLRHALWHVTMFPLILKTLSDVALVALCQITQLWEVSFMELPPLK